MTNDYTRRDFIKVAGATAGVAIAAGYSPFSYAQNEKVKVACIGTGGQGGFHIRFGLNENPDLEVVALCDCYKPNLDAAWKLAGGEDREIKRFTDYRRLLDEADFDAVVIATPLYNHYPIAMDCLDADKYVFCEKTLAYDVEECRNLVKKCNEKGTWLQVGHQRRYNPEYNKGVWLARGSETRASELGRINHVNAHWHRNNDWRRAVPTDYKLSPEELEWIKDGDLERHLNWRLYYERSRGGLITELATHQLDVTSWFLGAMPKRCAGFGGIDYWRDGREVHDNIVMIYDYEITQANPSFSVIPPRNERQRLAQINRPYTVRFTYSSICANARREYGEFIQGDRGSLYMTEQKGCTYYPEPAARESWNIHQAAADVQDTAAAVVGGGTRDYKDEAYAEGQKLNVVDDRGELYENPASVDRMQFTSFANDIRNGAVPKANQIVGLMSAISGFAAIEAMETGSTVEIDPALYTFDFETPDPFRFDFFEDPDYGIEQAEQA